MAKKVAWGLVLLFVMCLMAVGPARAEQPLTKDDLTLLLLGGASNEKIIKLVEQRGISFQMDPDFARKLHDSGASDALIEALQKAGEKAKAPSPSTTSAAPEPSPSAANAPAASTAPPAQPSAASPDKPKGGAGLTDPSPDQIQGIIQEFVGKEKLFKQARDNYTYHQINRVQELDVDGNVAGSFDQEWDILYDDKGGRIERVTYAPTPTLQGISVTQEDIESMRSIQPFVLTADELPEYDVKYLGHVKLDELTAYVFSVRPKELKKGRVYFQGTVWVDDRDLQVVKSEGKTVPEMRQKRGQMNLFPRFSTWREQIDGKYWFPTYTLADDTLYFPEKPVHVRQIIRYTDYKQFRATTKVLSVESIEKPKEQQPAQPPKPK